MSAFCSPARLYISMKLAILFACFLLGLITGDGNQLSMPEPILFLLLGISAVPVLFSGISGRIHFTSLGLASFFLGIIWISQLPTWPERLTVPDLPDDRGCAVVGLATAPSFECPEGRFLPLSIELVRGEGFSSEGRAVQEEWNYESGIILASVPRDFNGLPGARYQVYGTLDNSPDSLHKPLILRYRAQAIIRTAECGPIIRKISEPGLSADFSNRLRYRLMSHLSWGIGSRESELVAGITFGRKGRRLTGNWAGDFYSAGLSHLIVASGAQVSLLFLPIMFLLSGIRLPKLLKLVLLAILAFTLFGFARLLGGEPSILRAAAMGFILLLSLAFDRSTFGISTLAATGWFWLIINPLLVRDVGFMLSFGACFGIIYISPPLFDKFFNTKFKIKFYQGLTWFQTIGNTCVFGLKWLIKLLIGLSIITISAQIGVVPVLACTIGRISLSGFVANLFAVPIAQVILYLGALSGIGGFVSPFISMKINHVLDFLTRILMEIAHDFATIPNANLPIEPLPVIFAIAWYLFFVLLVENWRIGHYMRVRRSMKRKSDIKKHISNNPGQGSHEHPAVVEIDIEKPFSDSWFED